MRNRRESARLGECHVSKKVAPAVPHGRIWLVQNRLRLPTAQTMIATTEATNALEAWKGTAA